VATLYMSVIVLIPLAAVAVKAFSQGLGNLWQSITNSVALTALGVTLGSSLLVAAIGAVMGTLVAWVLVRDHFPGQRFVNALIDLPFALPTIVAGLTLLTLYGPKGGIGINVAYTRIGVGLALLFVTLPFVVRAVQPVLIELDTEMEEAAASLGAKPRTIFRRVILPNLTPAILSGVGLGFARAIGEFGSVVLISGNVPFKTEVASVFIYGKIQSDDVPGAAAVSVLLLLVAVLVLSGIGGLSRWRRRHEG
jgi:sulfate/thiosulfate transport system permease protein